MPKLIVNPSWMEKMSTLLNRGAKIDEIVSFNKSKQWLIIQLSERCLPFKVYNLGAGVCRITTDTTTCPCCGKALK